MWSRAGGPRKSINYYRGRQNTCHVAILGGEEPDNLECSYNGYVSLLAIIKIWR